MTDGAARERINEDVKPDREGATKKIFEGQATQGLAI
jgi:hypothetical protein